MACCACTENPRRKKRISWSIFFLAILGFIFCCVSIGHCTFFLRGFSSDDRDELDGFGLFSRADRDSDGKILGCVSYSDFVKDEVFEGPEKAARAFGVLAALCTGFGMTIVMALQLCLKLNDKMTKMVWLAVRILYGCGTVCQALTFTFFGSDSCAEWADSSSSRVCEAGAAGIISAFNIWILLTVSILTCLVGPPSPMLLVQMRDANADPTKPVGEGAAPSFDEGVEVEEEIEVDYAGTPQYDKQEEDARPPPPKPRMGGDDSATRRSTKPRRNKEQVEKVSVVVEHSKDGSKKTIRTVTKPDGTTTTTTTIEAPEV